MNNIVSIFKPKQVDYNITLLLQNFAAVNGSARYFSQFIFKKYDRKVIKITYSVSKYFKNSGSLLAGLKSKKLLFYKQKKSNYSLNVMFLYISHKNEIKIFTQKRFLGRTKPNNFYQKKFWYENGAALTLTQYQEQMRTFWSKIQISFFYGFPK